VDAAVPIARPLLVVLLVVNAMVLLGQLWPEGAPPFARAVNILFLVATFLLFATLLLRRRA
jgi:hypothetical protein